MRIHLITNQSLLLRCMLRLCYRDFIADLTVWAMTLYPVYTVFIFVTHIFSVALRIHWDFKQSLQETPCPTSLWRCWPRPRTEALWPTGRTDSRCFRGTRHHNYWRNNDKEYRDSQKVCPRLREFFRYQRLGSGGWITQPRTFFWPSLYIFHFWNCGWNFLHWPDGDSWIFLSAADEGGGGAAAHQALGSRRSGVAWSLLTSYGFGQPIKHECYHFSHRHSSAGVPICNKPFLPETVSLPIPLGFLAIKHISLLDNNCITRPS